MQTVSIVEDKYLSICELLRNTKQYLGKNSKMQSIRFSWECSVDGAPGFSGGAEAAVYNFFPWKRVTTQTTFGENLLYRIKRNTRSKQDTFEKIFSCPACILLLRHNAHTQNGKIVNFYNFIFLFDFMSQKLYSIHIQVEGKKHKVPKENLPDWENQQ